MMDALGGVGGLRLYRGGESQSGLFSFTVDGMDCEEVGQALARRGVAVRAGLHCAPTAHESAGTLDTGTLRVSYGPDASAGQTQALLQAAQVFRKKRR